LYIKTSTNLAS